MFRHGPERVQASKCRIHPRVSKDFFNGVFNYLFCYFHVANPIFRDRQHHKLMCSSKVKPIAPVYSHHGQCQGINVMLPNAEYGRDGHSQLSRAGHPLLLLPTLHLHFLCRGRDPRQKHGWSAPGALRMCQALFKGLSHFKSLILTAHPCGR